MQENITGKRLKTLRLDKEMSQEDVAKIIGISRPAYNKYESGAIKPVRKIKELCDLFGVSADYILGNEPSFTVTKSDKLPDKVVPIMQLAKQLFADDPDMLEQLTGAKEVYGKEEWLDIDKMPEEQQQMIKLALKAGFKSLRKD